MSRRSAGDQMAEDAAAGCFFVVFLALWAAIAGSIAAIVKSTQKTPEEQLQNMGAQPIFGAQIVGQPCPSCGEANEVGATLCFRCGYAITQVIPPTSRPSEPVNLDKLNEALSELSRRPSVISKGKTFKEVEIPLTLIVGVLFLFLLFIAAIT